MYRRIQNPTRFEKQIFAIDFLFAIAAAIIVEICKELYPQYFDIINIDHSNKIHPDVILATVAIIEVLVLLVIGLTGFAILKKKFSNLDYFDITIENKIRINQYKIIKGTSYLLICWLCLYLWMFIFWYGKLTFAEKINSSTLVLSVADLFRISTAIATFYCFFLLELPFKSAKTMYENKRKQIFKKRMFNILALSFIVLIISWLGRMSLFGLNKTGPLLLSFYVAISMQYYFGKLDSIYLEINRYLLSPLYFYILLQIMWAFVTTGDFGHDKVIIVYCVAFLLKIYFFIMFLYWLTKTDKFKIYLRHVIAP